MTDHLKLILVALFSVVLVACGSNQPVEEPVETTTEVIEPEVITSATDDGDVEETLYEDGLAPGVDTVFYFEFDKSNLSAAARAALSAHATAIKATDRSVRLEGHADERGTRDYNLALGERRAKAVADYLAIQGVSRSVIEIVSYGEEKPASLGSDEAAYAANRRVELK